VYGVGLELGSAYGVENLRGPVALLQLGMQQLVPHVYLRWLHTHQAARGRPMT
jgi:hypothetical protein